MINLNELDDKAFGKLWIWSGTLLFMISYVIFSRTQKWAPFNIPGEPGSYAASVYGVFIAGLLFLVVATIILFYSLQSPSDLWNARIPPHPSIDLSPEKNFHKRSQGFLLFFFLILPLYWQGHYLNKYMGGTATVLVKIEKAHQKRPYASKWIAHNGIHGHFSKYVPLFESIKLATAPGYRLYHFDDTNMTYYPFWGPVVILLYSCFVIMFGVLTLYVLFLPNAKLSCYLRTRYIFPQYRLNPDILNKSSRLQKNRNNFEHDVFISFSGTERKQFVKPLAEYLQSQAIKVWYDESIIKPGTNINSALYSGLAQSRYFLVILSHSFFNRRWTQMELHTIVKMAKKTEQVIIFIYYDIVADEVHKYFPEFSDIKALEKKNDIEVLASQIIELVNS